MAAATRTRSPRKSLGLGRHPRRRGPRCLFPRMGNRRSAPRRSTGAHATAGRRTCAALTQAHCHPTEEVRAGRDEDEWVQAAGDVALDKMCLMSTDTWDQRLVARAAAAWPNKVVPAFGFHPWFVHTLSLVHPAPPAHEHYMALLGPHAAELLPALPAPQSLDDAMAQLEAYLVAHPNALVGEVGLDRSFRIPIPHTSPRRLSRCQTPLAHQLAVLRAQVSLACRYRRSVSMHSVRAAGATTTFLDSAATELAGFSCIGVLLHSCTLSAQSLAQVQHAHANVFASFSTYVHFPYAGPSKRSIRLSSCACAIPRACYVSQITMRGTNSRHARQPRSRCMRPRAKQRRAASLKNSCGPISRGITTTQKLWHDRERRTRMRGYRENEGALG